MKTSSRFPVPFLNPNVSLKERVFSVLTGSALGIHALFRKQQKFPEILLSSYLLFRGIFGFCAVYKVFGKNKLRRHSQNINTRVSLEVARPRQEVYEVWRNLENLPQFMMHLKNVQKSLWIANFPGELGHICWKSEIVKERHVTFLGCQSLPGSKINNAGKVEFKDSPGGTKLEVAITYHASLGIAGEGWAEISNPLFEQVLREDILNFKAYMEGEKPLSEPKDQEKFLT